jgi:dimethylargininase
VSPAISRCELTHLPRRPIDLERAIEQHREYETALEELGCRLLRLPAESDLPDSVFVEDTAVVLDEAAVIARPGAASRRAETESVAAALSPLRPLTRIRAPATMDGGDILRVGRQIFVGLSSRTNEQAREQLRELLAPHGYEVRCVDVHRCLHLKSAVTPVAEQTLLLNPDLADPAAFAPLRCIEVDPAEPAAANALLVGKRVIFPSALPKTVLRLEGEGVAVRTVDISELAKAEGGVTCCSLILEG